MVEEYASTSPLSPLYLPYISPISPQLLAVVEEYASMEASLRNMVREI